MIPGALVYPATLAAWGIGHSLWIAPAVAWAARWADRRLAGADPTLRYRLLVAAALTMVALCVLPAVEVHRSMFSAHVAAEAASRQGGGTAASAGPLRLLPAAGAAWALGAVLALVRLAVGLVRLDRLVRGARPSRRGLLLAARVGEPTGVDVREIEVGSSPFVAGLRRPVLVVPRRLLRGLSSDQLVTLVRHELAHVRRRDYAQNLLQRAVECLFWFNPGAAALSRRIREAREACCDRAAVRVPGDGVALARALIDLEEGRVAVPAGVAAAQDGDLTRRVRSLIEPPRVPSRREVGGTVALVAAFLPLVAWGVFALAAPSGSLTRRAMPLTRVTAMDPGGRFVVEMLGGRVLAAGLDGAPPRTDVVSQRGRRAAIYASSGREALELTVRVGGFRWHARPSPSLGSHRPGRTDDSEARDGRSAAK